MSKSSPDKITEELIARLHQVRENRKKPPPVFAPRGLSLVAKLLDDEIVKVSEQLKQMHDAEKNS